MKRIILISLALCAALVVFNVSTTAMAKPDVSQQQKLAHPVKLKKANARKVSKANLTSQDYECEFDVECPYQWSCVARTCVPTQ